MANSGFCTGNASLVSPRVSLIPSTFCHQPGTEVVSIPYEICEFSSAATTYLPHHIMHDLPGDEGSRWTTCCSDQSQFLTLFLSSPAVVMYLVFGKYHKPHVCNLKEFRVLGGITISNMSEIFHGGLENNDSKERIAVKHQSIEGVLVPIQYVKIVPHSSYQKEFPYSIWYLDIQGFNQKDIILSCLESYNRYRESEALRQCLKFLRERNLKNSFATLADESGVQLEDPELTKLHQILVVEADFDGAESVIQNILSVNTVDDYVSVPHWSPRWKELFAYDEVGNSPCMRGGHGFCAVTSLRCLILFGGWDGVRELNDLWLYNIPQQTWTCLSQNTLLQGGPGPRSCHKLCLDPSAKIMYLIGRYYDNDSRHYSCLDSDFWAYDVLDQQWTLISSNTASEKGPPLVYDHQLAMDHATRTLYMFGGRVITQETTSQIHSGLYAYSISNNSWKNLRQEGSYQDFPGRVGHFMGFHQPTRQLLVLGGQRNKEMFNHFLAYNVENDTITKLGLPQYLDTTLTQRAALDEKTGTLLVFSSLLGRPNCNSSFGIPATLVYHIRQGVWRRIICADMTGERQPKPRFAHQMAYDPQSATVFVFGGNPDSRKNPQQRLDDFWALQLQQPCSVEILKVCQFLIRKQKYLELCRIEPKAALFYLQKNVSETVDHRHPIQSKDFMNLTAYLFDKGKLDNENFPTLHHLYEQLVSFLPKSMKQPARNVVDCIMMD